MICTVCNKEKEDNQFQTYFHSTQNKFRTRRQCTECFYKKKLLKKNPDKYYSNKPEYRKCNTCFEYKLIAEGYYLRTDGSVYLNRCKECERALEHKRRELELSQTCGSDRVKVKPNEYTDEYQRACTFDLMEKLGYTFDDNTGIWIKPNWKEVKDGKPYFPKILTYLSPKSKMTKDMFEQMVHYHQLGKNNKWIGKKLKVSGSTIRIYLIKWKEGLRLEN